MDNFDLKKFLKESKALENLNPIIGKNTNIHGINEGNMRDKIREMILAELGNPDDYDYDPTDDYGDDESGYYSHMRDLEDKAEEDRERDEAYLDGGFGSFEEAKKKKDEEVEDVETTDTETTDTTEEIPADEAPADEAPAADGGLEDVAADMEGTEGELMDHLMSAFKIAKGMNNEKLETQVGNTLKFFVSEYIGGGEQ
jgi:hypothetical protein